MFSNNVTKFLLNMVADGKLTWNMEDEIVRDTLVCHRGEVTGAARATAAGYGAQAGCLSSDDSDAATSSEASGAVA